MSAEQGRKDHGMPAERRARGRPRRYARFEEWEAQLLARKPYKRPAYLDGIGIYHGTNASTAWTKIRLPRGGTFKGRTIPPGQSVEIKLGKRSSWEWQQLFAERDRLQGLADRGEPLEPATVETFSKYAAGWLARKKPTMKGYDVTKGHINTALNPSFGKKALNAITTADVNKWIAKQSEGLKPATVRRQLSTFNAILNDARRSGIIENNPSDNSDKIRGIEGRDRFLTEAEWKTVWQTAEKIEQGQEKNRKKTPQQIRGWLRHFLLWALHSGMRRGEILNLTWDCVREVSDERTVVEVKNTKTGKPRFVTCTDEMKRILKALAKLDKEEGDNRLFPLSMTTLKRTLTHLWKKSGLLDVRLHDLRRTHATMLMEQNIDARTIAGRLGHSGTNMLAKHYAVNRGDTKAAKVFDAATWKSYEVGAKDASRRTKIANDDDKADTTDNQNTNL